MFSFFSMFGAVESGLIFAIMALGVYLSFRVLDFPDLTVDGSFVTGAAVAAICIVNGVSPIIGTLLAFVAGFIAGNITGLLNTKGKINPLLSGILMMTALYSINLRIMGGSPNIPLLNETTVFNLLEPAWAKTGVDQYLGNMLESLGVDVVPSTWIVIFVMIIVIIFVKLLLDYYLKTEIGLALRATGDNDKMIRSFSANTDNLKIVGLGISNGLVALAGALISQNDGFVDLKSGIGMIVIGLASVIIGEALFGKKTIVRTTLAVIGGAIIYRIVVTMALGADFLETGDMKLISAILVVIALVAPKMIDGFKDQRRRQRKRIELNNRAKGA